MKSKDKFKLIASYDKLKNKSIKRWEERIKKENRITTTRVVNEHMANEIEDLRAYIRQLKQITTRIITHERSLA